MMRHFLNIRQEHFEALYRHLFPGDGQEAIAFALCGSYRHGTEVGLLVHELSVVPYASCSVRTPELVTWSTHHLRPLLDTCVRKNLTLVKVHSHPGGQAFFSEQDDESDAEIARILFEWHDSADTFGSLVMLPTGRLIGRMWKRDGDVAPIDRFRVVGADIKVQDRAEEQDYNLVPGFARRTAQAFGEQTTRMLAGLRIGVVGCSGTGSIVIEQLARLGVGELVLVDPDRVEEKNLNRILNSTRADVTANRLKVAVMQRSIAQMGLQTKVYAYAHNLYDQPDALLHLAGCDLVFGCMDSIDGRHLLNLLTTCYMIPYIDLGVKLVADGAGGLDSISTAVHFVLPGDSLRNRGVFNQEELAAADLKRNDSEMYAEQLKAAYIVNLPVERPAVISINMMAAAQAVMEMLARIHPYRNEPNEAYAAMRTCLKESCLMHDDKTGADDYLMSLAGRGDQEPFLGMPAFGRACTTSHG